MYYRNMDTDELAREASVENNTLALTILDRMEDEARELVEQYSEGQDEIVSYFAGKVESLADEMNSEDLEEDSDNVRDIVGMLMDGDMEYCLRTAIDAMDKDEALSPDELEALQAMASERHGLEDLLDAIYLCDGEATVAHITQGYGPCTCYSLACYAMGEREYELEHLLESADVPAVLWQQVSEKIGTGAYYYIDNTDVAVDVCLNLAWLSTWLEDNYFTNES